jgi:hypothetical protein
MVVATRAAQHADGPLDRLRRNGDRDTRIAHFHGHFSHYRDATVNNAPQLRDLPVAACQFGKRISA